ncbi:MAG: rhodanese-like domain-containing protein [Desulfobulbaceae bacterium]|jgi:rhodanese-related sulfurtransferase|nr:rhodanese-like domain-containing protein [Desulfobulbaceae bacterium]MDY0350065.1 rhodanese-like domain-containing protein [Desulfobulbaceae bacterium]
MKRIIAVFLAMVVTGILGATGTILAGDYRYITADELNARLEAGSPMILIDIQPAEQFAMTHIDGAIETNAFPVKSEEDKARLAGHLPLINSSADDVVILCPRGGGGARGAYDLYKTSGVDANRLLILEKGMAKWPFRTVAK